MDGRPLDPDPRVRGAVPGGAGAAGVLALLAGPPREWRARHLPLRLVLAASPRPRVRKDLGRRARRTPDQDPLLRGDPREFRGGPPQVLDAPRPEAPEETARVAGEGPSPVLARHQAGLGALEDVPGVRLRRRADHRPDQHRARAVDDHRGCGPALPEPGGGEQASRRDRAPPRRRDPAGERTPLGPCRRSPGERIADPGALEPGSHPEALAQGLLTEAERASSAAQPPPPQGEGPQDVGGPGLRGLGRGRQGRGDPPDHAGARCAATTR